MSIKGTVKFVMHLRPGINVHAARKPTKMTEVRARAARHKGQLNFESELRQALYACGDDDTAIPETLRVLDEIVTDFIIETCHTAARSATYSNRQKIKVDDFKFAIRKSEFMLGRVQDMAARAAYVERTRKGHFKNETAEGFQGLERGGASARKYLKDMGDGADDGEGEGGDRPKKRRKRRTGADAIVLER